MPSYKQHSVNERKTGHYLYSTWLMMKRRCFDPNHTTYRFYGGRGILMDRVWFLDFWRFVRDVERKLGPRPFRHQIDRINNDGHYTLANVRWLSADVNLLRRFYSDAELGL